MRDHTGLVSTNFRGTYGRGGHETSPEPGFFISSQNVQFGKGVVKTRFGSSLVHTVSSVKRIAVYKILGQANRLLILNNTGSIYDSTNLATPVLTITSPLMTDFSMTTIFDRAYITPHNGQTGLAGEKVYVYDGSSPARAAAGTPPSAFTLVAAESGSSGTVEAGQRAYAICYETSSGFITAPGGFVSLTSTGGFKVDLSNAIVGPAGTSKRIVVATKALIDFNGDFANQTYYFVPNGEINDNTTTTITVDFYDADLQDDASFLFDQESTIPAGVGIALVGGRMVVWGEDSASELVRVSTPGEPESHNSISGFITVNPGDAGGGVKNCCEYRGQLIIAKSQRWYAAQPSDTDDPANWPIIELDSSVGTECHGIAKSLDFGANVEDRIFVADRAGLRVFSGTFGLSVDAGGVPDILSFNIDDLWSRINKTYFYKVEVAIDPVNFAVFVCAPLDSSSTCNAIFAGSYAEGLNSAAMQWTTWIFPTDIDTIVTTNVSNSSILMLGSASGNVYKYDSAQLLDYGTTAIDHWVEFPFYPGGDTDDIINHYTGVKLRVSGSGNLLITGRGLDSILSFSAVSLALTSLPGYPLFRGFNFTTDRCSVKLRMTNANEYFTLTKFTLYMTPVWEDRPQT